MKTDCFRCMVAIAGIAAAVMFLDQMRSTAPVISTPDINAQAPMNARYTRTSCAPGKAGATCGCRYQAQIAASRRTLSSIRGYER